MHPCSPSQQDSWQSNVYVVSTIRFLINLLLIFLINSAYRLFQRMRSSGGNRGSPVARASGAVERDIEALALEALGAASMSNLGSTDGTSETINVILPQPAHASGARSASRPTSPH